MKECLQQIKQHMDDFEHIDISASDFKDTLSMLATKHYDSEFFNELRGLTPEDIELFIKESGLKS